jgi:hypothetical protein
LGVLLGAAGLRGQEGGPLTVATPASTILKRGAAASIKIAVSLRSGYHVNSHSPNDEFLIPLTLRFDQAGPVKATEVNYPKPEQRDYGFSEKPVSVFTGNFVIITRLQAVAEAPAGAGVLAGKLRYQACTENLCLPPRTIEVRLPYEIR